MRPFEILRALRQHNVAIEFERDELVLLAPMAPPDELLAHLRWHIDTIKRLLEPDEDGWTGEDVFEYVNERAAILEHDHRHSPVEVMRMLVDDARRGLVPPSVARVLEAYVREEARIIAENPDLAGAKVFEHRSRRRA